MKTGTLVVDSVYGGAAGLFSLYFVELIYGEGKRKYIGAYYYIADEEVGLIDLIRFENVTQGEMEAKVVEKFLDSLE